ncbi:MAG TPA: DUF2892 domain-containing protein [Gammaproteobacteria bacterium]|nr:DUF2892 domain-containing protein [Gammaproteobacteria bacterium]
MTKNMGRIDQVLRLGISIVLIYVGFVDQELINDHLTSMIAGIIGIVNLLSALIGICPLYSITGINTCHKEGK